jgi:hypothetical protein
MNPRPRGSSVRDAAMHAGMVGGSERIGSANHLLIAPIGKILGMGRDD